MDYGIALLTGLLAFISPCVLPMLPVFITYFTAGESSKKRTLINAIGFAIGLIIVMVAIGAVLVILAVGFGKGKENFVEDNRRTIDIICGCIIIVMGFIFMGFIKIPFLNGGSRISVKTENMKFFSALLFGMVYAISFGPCVVPMSGTTTVAAIKLAIEYGEYFQGIMLQLTFAVTLGLLFVISAMLIDYLKGVFSFIKKHQKVFNIVSGAFLILLGVLMATGAMTMFTNWLAGKLPWA